MRSYFVSASPRSSENLRPESVKMVSRLTRMGKYSQACGRKRGTQRGEGKVRTQVLCPCRSLSLSPARVPRYYSHLFGEVRLQQLCRGLCPSFGSRVNVSAQHPLWCSLEHVEDGLVHDRHSLISRSLRPPPPTIPATAGHGQASSTAGWQVPAQEETRRDEEEGDPHEQGRKGTGDPTPPGEQ
jgi:hypothetical protein